MNAPIKKHPQFIFAAAAGFFRLRGFTRGIKEYSFDSFYSEVNSALAIREREYLENDSGYRQLLPYTIVTQIGTDKVMRFQPYMRLEGGGESKLHNKVSCGYGGHVDLEDTAFAGQHPGSKARSTPDLRTTIHTSVAREIAEELKLAHPDLGIVDFAPQIKGSNLFIHDDTNAVDVYHVALIHFARLNEGERLVSGEPDQIELLPLATASEILATYPNLEGWTKLFLEYVVGVEQASKATAG